MKHLTMRMFETIGRKLWIAWLFAATLLPAQTTQGLISGRLLNSVNGRPIASATIQAIGTGTADLRSTSDAQGYFYLPLLSPATYRLRVTARTYQSQEIQELVLPVAARLEIDFRLRPLSDVWESGQFNSVFLPGTRTIVTFFGPDVDASRSGSFEAQQGRTGALESTVSSVIDSGQLGQLPLLGRDVYTMLVTEPGVTSDGATARGLGLAINGQRPAASNYLLDGLENNNYLITGPLVQVAPEAIQEYRVSINNFSAEYGRTAGFLANAITRSGTNQFHGTGYFYLKNEALNANGFQENRRGTARRPVKESQPGFVVGGPILRDKLFFSISYEFFRSRSVADSFLFTFPNTPVFLSAVAIPGRKSRELLTNYPAPAVSGPGVTGTLRLSPPVSVNRHLAVERLDHSSKDGRDRFMARLMIARLGRPDFIWTPYKDFVSALSQNTWALGGSYLHQFTPAVTNEVRVGVSRDDLSWDRPHPEIPTLTSGDGVMLPGSPAFYAYRNVNRSQELLDNVLWTHGRHLITFGAGALFRNSEGYLTAGRDGQYLFSNAISFGLDRPTSLRLAVQRVALPTLSIPQYDRTYAYRQFFGFVQDTFKLSRRLTANYGLRYEFFGGPANTGDVKDLLVKLGAGDTLARQLPSATLALGSGRQQLFSSDARDWAVRAGMSYDLTNKGRTLLRGAYGIFYDRPYDNLWQNLRNNNLVLPSFTITTSPYDFLAPVASTLPNFVGRPVSNAFPELTLVNPDIKNGYVHSYFAGVEHRFADSLTAEVNALGSYGRRLITTDVVNRDFSTAFGRYNNNLPNIAYRDGQGYSDYNALTAVVRWRAERGYLQASYTWSHTIDNQSDALAGDFFSLTFTSIASSSGASGRATFSRQFDPRADRGNADFDQRHNFVLQGYWNPAPALMETPLRSIARNWNFGTLVAIRSGFPYTVLGTSTVVAGGGLILNNRPDLLNPLVANLNQRVDGGVRLLNAAAFTNASASTLGNLGRNAFIGPGFYNIDANIGRSFALPWLGEGTRMNFRADVFNLLNHANLGNPDTLLGSAQTPNTNFGIATYGRQSSQKGGFPAVSPLAEIARQIQFSVRIVF